MFVRWDLGGTLDGGWPAPWRGWALAYRLDVESGPMNFAQASQKIDTATVQLSVAGVSKHFGGVTAVEDVSIDVPQGRIVSIIGPNGAGKTSLLNMISGFYKRRSGVASHETTRSALPPICPDATAPNEIQRTASVFAESCSWR